MITHCICYDLSFKEIKSILDTNNINTLEELQDKHDICDKCCMCNEYIERMIHTGETKFEVGYL
jgi:bacterioferritin-associated ferredoxin